MLKRFFAAPLRAAVAPPTVACCPRCSGERRLQRGICPNCRGELLDLDATDDFLVAAGLPRDRFLNALMERGENSIGCPWCQGRMRAVDVKGERIDNCGACGSTWLDAHEGNRILSTLGEPRREAYAEQHRPLPAAMVPVPQSRTLDMSVHLPGQPAPTKAVTLNDPMLQPWGGASLVIGGLVGFATQNPIWGLLVLGLVLAVGKSRVTSIRRQMDGLGSLRGVRPVLQLTEGGIYVDLGTTKANIPVEAGAIAELRIVRDPSPNGQHQLWLSVDEAPPVCVVATDRQEDMKEPVLAVENWLRGVVGIEVYRAGTELPPHIAEG